jgi:tetratricopeptide (TPR) repeat protein
MDPSASVPGIAPEELPALALSRPQSALAQARELADSTSDPYLLSYARQAVGIVLRDSGQMAPALTELRGALRAARGSGRPDRDTDVRATLGAALVMDGRTRAGLGQLDAAACGARGPLLARVLMRRAYALTYLGRHSEALVDIRRALAGIRAADDTVWEARVLNTRADIHLAQGSLARAEHDVRRAQELFRAAGQELEVVLTVHNRGVIAYCRGDLPSALRLYDEAARGYADLSVSSPDLAFDRCTAFLAAGLTSEAVEVVAAAVAAPALQPLMRAELLLIGSAAALADGRTGLGLGQAREARRLFRRQDRDWWEVRAELAVVRARRAGGESGPALLEAAASLGGRLQDLRSADAPVALLLAGQLAADRGLDTAHGFLEAAGRYRRREPALTRATGWLARALDRASCGDTRGVFAACSRGLDALDEHRMSLGSSELRALATRHGEELAHLALREAVSTGEARRLLTWSERWRATALTQPPLRPPREAGLERQLAVLRSRSRRHDEVRSGAGDIAALEQSIRSQQHQLPGMPGSWPPFDVRDLTAELGDSVLVELVEVDGVLQVITVSRTRVRSQPVGSVDDALGAVAAARFVLRQVARGRPASLRGIGERLQATLLGPAIDRLGGGPVIVAPPSRLHATPWGLLPALAHRPVSVVPSARTWLRARAVTPPARARTVLVAGPGLRTGGAEVDALARSDRAALLLRDGAATVSACLASLDGAGLGHIAAHGRFRPDNPMFSSLMLDDGPLTVHDFERLERAPYRLVLSACDSGVMVPVGANELLGLGSALLSLGTAGLVSSIAEVNDEATVDLMLGLHAGLGRGVGLPEVLLLARERARGDLVSQATASAFVALGV